MGVIETTGGPRRTVSAGAVTAALKKAGHVKAENQPTDYPGQQATVTPGFRSFQVAPWEVHAWVYDAADSRMAQALELQKMSETLAARGYLCGVVLPPGDRRPYLSVTKALPAARRPTNS
ncbi:hypothetical protein E6R60_26755 [Streptomyces sp. A0642]|uniref:hypothetical protein n=1 Tax=Streptomyces sp. A0642 TaxID=2563100 RepID=UPI0010A2792A|nr:hypothetical protein [Streptomyces sp. A0642]THA72531.1 hypothetical protein E6R60_26755 [Streptomyces sp. A0642]